jgi:hypothetical protein
MATVPTPFCLITVADKTTCCGLPPPLSVTATSPLKLSDDDELKLTVIVQDAPAPTLVPQLFVWEKFVEPVILMLVMPRTVVPVLVSVVVCGGAEQLVPKIGITHEKCRLLGFNLTSVPVPLRETAWGLPGALSETDSLAVRVLMALGVNVTLIVQLVPAATELPQVLV